MKILVVDDHEAFRKEIEDILVRNGHDAQGVESADAAIPLVEAGSFDFVLVDYQMPEHDGIWFMTHVSLPRKTKALLVTAHVSKELINRMFEAGVSGYVSKPFEESDLLRHLDFHTGGPPASVS